MHSPAGEVLMLPWS